MKLLQLFCFLIITCCFIGCSGGPNAIYHSYHHVSMPWVRNDTLSFQIPVPDTLEQYQAFVLIRNLDVYPYQNLAIRIEHDLHDSLSWDTDTLYCDLTDKKSEIWNVSEWGGLHQKKIPLENSVIRQSRTFHFKVTHLMENDSLTGINDIGIMIER